MKSIASALAKAQSAMGKALKQSDNPHFRSKYADLGNVMDACLPALNEAGIALIQPTGEEDGQRFVETILIHGESGETLACRVPLIVSKNDMQGYGSAVTYARRYGLMTMAGIAPEDDDGEAARRAKPTQEANRRTPPALKEPVVHSPKPEALRDTLIGNVQHHDDPRYKADLERLRDISEEFAGEVDEAILVHISGAK